MQNGSIKAEKIQRKLEAFLPTRLNERPEVFDSEPYLRKIRKTRQGHQNALQNDSWRAKVTIGTVRHQDDNLCKAALELRRK